MTTNRKLTMAASYIRSAAADVAISSPTLSREMYSLLIGNLEYIRSKRSDLMGQSYNISRKK